MEIDWGKLSKFELDVFKKLKNIKVVFDIGTRDNIDYLKIKPKATYHFFEPMPELFQLLKAKVWGKTNVHLNNYGLGDVEGQFGFTRVSQAFEGGDMGLKGGDLILPIKTLDWYIEQNDIKRIDFLKIDAEGYDYKILLGGPKAIKLARYIQVEYWDNPDKFIALLKDFKVEEIGERNILCTRFQKF